MIDHDEFDHSILTDVGVKRSHNQDAYALLLASDAEQFRLRGHIYLVADGMGGHAVGELASKMAADSIPHIYSKHAQDGPIEALRRAFVEANQTIHNRGQANREFHGMGTTGTALVLRPEGAWVGHVGDSRAYRIRGGFIEQLSFDHSLLWELAKRQRRNPDDLSGVRSNVILRSLGPEPTVVVDVEGPHPIFPGDTYVLCSDGLSGPVNDREIGAICGALTPDEASRFLIHLANLQGGPDNITALVIKVRGEAPSPSTDLAALETLWSAPPLLVQARDFLKKSWAFVALILGILLAMGAIFLSATDRPGEFAAFVIAGLLLVAGLVGLMMQSLWERKIPGTKNQRRKLHVYRQIPCAIDEALVDRLDSALGTLRQRVDENQWAYEGAEVDTFVNQCQAARKNQDWLDTFRNQCRAMLILMDAVQQHRNKEEAFRPLWDKTPG